MAYLYCVCLAPTNQANIGWAFWVAGPDLNALVTLQSFTPVRKYRQCLCAEMVKSGTKICSTVSLSYITGYISF